MRGGGPGPDLGGRAALDAAGHLFVATQFTGSATYGPNTLTSPGNNAGALLQLDAATAAVGWARTLVSNTGATFYYVATDAGGNVYASAQFTGTATLG